MLSPPSRNQLAYYDTLKRTQMALKNEKCLTFTISCKQFNDVENIGWIISNTPNLDQSSSFMATTKLNPPTPLGFLILSSITTILVSSDSARITIEHHTDKLVCQENKYNKAFMTGQKEKLPYVAI